MILRARFRALTPVIVAGACLGGAAFAACSNDTFGDQGLLDAGGDARQSGDGSQPTDGGPLDGTAETGVGDGAISEECLPDAHFLCVDFEEAGSFPAGYPPGVSKTRSIPPSFPLCDFDTDIATGFASARSAKAFCPDDGGTATEAYLAMAHAPAQHVFASGRFRIDSAPVPNLRLLTIVFKSAAPDAPFAVGLHSTGLGFVGSSGTFVGDLGFSPQANSWFRLELELDLSVNPMTATIRVTPSTQSPVSMTFNISPPDSPTSLMARYGLPLVSAGTGAVIHVDNITLDFR